MERNDWAEQGRVRFVPDADAAERSQMKKWLTDWLKKLFDGWWKKKPDPKPEEDQYVDDIDFSKVVVYTTSKDRLLKFKITNGIARVWKDNQLRWEFAKPLPWKNGADCVGNIWMFWKEGSTWHGGPCDGIREGQNHKNAGDFKRSVAPWQSAQDGEEVALMFSTNCRHNNFMNGEERTAILKFIWPPKG